jgi:nucleoside-diphosphate-sugar epimerase
MQGMTGILFCFGLGYSAQVLARRLARQGWTITGTAQTGEHAAALAREGWNVHLFHDGEFSPAAKDALAAADTVLISIPPGEAGDPVLAAEADALRAHASRWRWLGYLSTTGVYGDRQGGWVDETTQLAPTSPRAVARVAAENAWKDFAAATGAPLTIFRLAGIYGPGRNPLAALRAGTARRTDKPGQVFSRIHVEDLARVLAASIAQPHKGGVYNVCDDEPAAQADVVAHGAQLLGIAPPLLESYAAVEPTLSEMAKSFYRDSKRVRNARMKRELGVVLSYPSYREGLASLIDAK